MLLEQGLDYKQTNIKGEKMDFIYTGSTCNILLCPDSLYNDFI